MKKKWLGSLLVGSLCLALVFPGSAYADGRKVVTLGADLTDDQKTAVLKYFGVLGQNIQTLTITNQDEREHLGAYLPLEWIGTHTFSCAYVCPTTSGGIQVKTANLEQVTSNMIATTLSTSGVVNCDVVAASPFPVSGTGALTGIMMAYESASGTTLDPVKKDLATQEIVATSSIASEIGQAQATNIVNEIKIQVIEGAVVEPDEVEEIIDDVVESNPEVTLSDEDRALLTGLMTQIAEQQYDYDEMKDTLQRVEENVSDLSSKVNDIQQTPDINIEINNNNTVENNTTVDNDVNNTNNNNDTNTQEQTLDADSILMNTDDSALGENVTIDATNEQALPEETQEPAENTSVDGFEITTSDSYSDDGSAQVQEPVISDSTGTDDGYNWNESVDTFDGDDWNVDGSDDWNIDSGSDGSDSWNIDSGSDSSDDWNIDTGLDDGNDWNNTEGEFTDDVNSQDGGEDAAPAASNLELDEIRTSPENGAYAGDNQIHLYFNIDNIVPVSGSLTITLYGEEVSHVDLADKDQAVAMEMSDEDKEEFFWNAGTEIVINTDTYFNPNGMYTIRVEGEVAQAADPTALENAPTAVINETWDIVTDVLGVVISTSRESDVKTGASMPGNVLFLDDSISYAVISEYDADAVSFDTEEFTPENSTFIIYCNESGKTEFTVDYYDADGGYIGSAVRTLNIL